LIGGEGVLSGGVIAGDGEVVGLAGGQGLDSGGGGIARIEGLGVNTCGSAVMDVVADHGGIGVRVPGQGDALGGLGQGQGANQERGARRAIWRETGRFSAGLLGGIWRLPGV
jgi:hypothetical protein